MIRRARSFDPDSGAQRSWAVDEQCTACGRRLQCATAIPSDQLHAVHRTYGCGRRPR